MYLEHKDTRRSEDQKEYYSLYIVDDNKGGGPIDRRILLSFDKSQPDASLMINLDLIKPPVIQSDLFFPVRCEGCEKSDFYNYELYMRDASLKQKFFDPKYPNCYLGSFASKSVQNKCHVSYCFDQTGGGVDVMNLPNGSEKEIPEKPFSKDYMTCTYPREDAYDDFTKQMRSLLYRDLEKLWKCYDRKDIGCIGDLTNFQSIFGDDKWRIQSAIYPKDCHGIGKQYSDVPLQLGEISTSVSGHHTLTKQEYFNCLLKIKNPMVFRFDYSTQQKYIKSPYIVNVQVRKDPSVQEKHQVSFLLTSGNDNEGIRLTYGTPANPKRFAITAIGHPYMVGPPDKVKEIEQIEDQKKK